MERTLPGLLNGESRVPLDVTRRTVVRSRNGVESRVAMPEVSRFFGVVIRMHFNDHDPAHFHAVYGDAEALVEIGTLMVLRGWLPRRALALVLEWAALHRAELKAGWEMARRGRPVAPIEPLD